MRGNSRPNLHIELVPVSSLTLDPRNPRQHSKRQITQIARSIKSFGFNVPVLVDEHNKVLAGHGRVLACQQLGRQEVPALRLTHLSAAQARAFSIADNRLTDNSEWNDQLLGEIFVGLSAADLDFSIEDTGFSIGEIDIKIEALSEPKSDESDPDDDLPEIPSRPALTKPGDLWLMGKHRVLCGNSLAAVAYETLMQGARANVIFADPPYNVPVDGHVSGKGKIHHREFAMASGEMTEGQFIDFLSSVFRSLAQHSARGSLHFVCIDWRHLTEILAAGREQYSELKALCVWVKNNGGMGSLYRNRHELIFVFKNGTSQHRNNVQLGKYGRNRTNVWDYPAINDFGRLGEEGHNPLALHPTVKPVLLIADVILDCSARGDVVLDPFLGSGSTLIAAERVGRVCYGIEIDPTYVDTAIRRWQRHAGEKAVHAVTGRRFDEIAAAMRGNPPKTAGERSGHGQHLRNSKGSAKNEPKTPKEFIEPVTITERVNRKRTSN